MRTALSLVSLSFLAAIGSSQLTLPFSGVDATATISSFQIQKSGTAGRASTLFITNASNTSDAFLVNTVGLGRAGYFTISNAANTQIALRADTNGSGIGVFGLNTGTGRAGFFRIINTLNTSPALHAQTDGTGPTLRLQAGTGLALEANGRTALLGSVGIGTISPSRPLHVFESSAGFSPNFGSDRIVNESSNAAGFLGLTSPSGQAYVRFQAGNTNIASLIANSIVPGGLVITTGNTLPRMAFLPNGPIGIKTLTPSADLEVAGFTKTSTFQVTTGAALGRVLTSDANGLATWQLVGNTQLASDPLSMSKVSGGSVVVDGNGNVGFGTGADALFQRLSVKNGGITVTKGPGLNQALMSMDANGGRFQIIDSAGVQKVTLSASGSPLGGRVFVHDANGATQVTLSVNSSGLGVVSADTKSFKVVNPSDPKADIWYASVEGPEAGAYIRGTAKLVDGRAFVSFPDHFKLVATLPGMTVQLTPHSVDTYGLAVIGKSLDGITVAELQRGRGNFEFDWEVKAVRKGHENFRVVRPWDEDLPETDRDAAWAARLKSIADRKRTKNP